MVCQKSNKLGNNQILLTQREEGTMGPLQSTKEGYLPLRRPVRSDEQTWRSNTLRDDTGGIRGGINCVSIDGHTSSIRLFKRDHCTGRLTLGTTHKTTKHHFPSVEKSATKKNNPEILFRGIVNWKHWMEVLFITWQKHHLPSGAHYQILPVKD